MKSPKCFLYESPRTELDKQPLLIKLLASENEYEGGLFQVIPAQPFRNLVEWENDMTQADYLILPVNYVVALQDINYLEGFFRTAKENNLKVLITNHGDYTEPIEVKNGVILKTSAYKDELQKNEIIIPAFVEDVGLQYTCTPRLKKSEVPTIGFSGMVQLPTILAECKYQLRLIRQRFLIHTRRTSPASYQGLYYRRIAIAKIKHSKLCKAFFYIRSSFGRNLKTIQGSPHELRQEFIDSIVNADLALVVRGDGNFSLRFFEVLSLGRIPLFIDTDSPLPLENKIDYDSFMLRVDHTEIHRLPEIVHEWWQNISPEEYIAMQKRARKAFEDHLKPEVFYKNLFSKLATEK